MALEKGHGRIIFIFIFWSFLEFEILFSPPKWVTFSFNAVIFSFDYLTFPENLLKYLLKY